MAKKKVAKSKKTPVIQPEYVCPECGADLTKLRQQLRDDYDHNGEIDLLDSECPECEGALDLRDLEVVGYDTPDSADHDWSADEDE